MSDDRTVDGRLVSEHPVPVVYDHAARPGPQYWDWRCLVCSQPVGHHAGLWARWRWRRRQRGG